MTLALRMREQGHDVVVLERARAAGGLGGFFPPVFVGLVKDAQGTYTYGFIGLLVFVAVCLALAVWLLRTAPQHELRGVSATPGA